jgi:hypothetical protein
VGLAGLRKGKKDVMTGDTKQVRDWKPTETEEEVGI